MAVGFSLIELLVVIGIIVLMIGALGLALRGGGGNTALQSAQGTVASMVAATRAQAALNQSAAYLAVDANPTSETFLRGLHVALQDASGWRFVSDTLLPSGVGLVPGNGGTTGVTTASGWPATHISTLQAPVSLTISGQPGQYLLSSCSFDAAGKFNPTSVNSGDKLVLATCRQVSPGTWVLDNPQSIRGVTLSAYGATILINDAAGFDN